MNEVEGIMFVLSLVVIAVGGMWHDLRIKRIERLMRNICANTPQAIDGVKRDCEKTDAKWLKN